jgi:hypothetical protein
MLFVRLLVLAVVVTVGFVVCLVRPRTSCANLWGGVQ